LTKTTSKLGSQRSSGKRAAETLVLLQILKRGESQIEEGKAAPAREVLCRLRERARKKAR
jgi:hypothetical protein